MNDNNFEIESIVLAHRFYARPHWISYEYVRQRPCHGLVYVLEGSAEYELNDGNIITANKDDILYMPEGTPYLTRCREEGFLHMTINFKMRGSISLPLCRPCSENETTRRDMARLVSEWTQRQLCYREKSIGMLYLLLSTQIEYVQGSMVPASAEKIGKAIELLNAETGNIAKVSDLASACGMSETYFRRLFRQVYGVSPQVYLTQRRIAYACDLLNSTRISIEQVSYASGYQDPAYFCRIFKKVMGVSPSAYRMQLETHSAGIKADPGTVL